MSYWILNPWPGGNRTSGYEPREGERSLRPDDFDKPYVPVYPCSECNLEFLDEKELRKHRFEAHPFIQPHLLIRSRRLDESQTMRITAPLRSAEVEIQAKAARLNGKELSVPDLTLEVASLRTGIHCIEIRNGPIKKTHRLDFRIADPKDLRGVEEALESLIVARRLSKESIQSFVDACSRFTSALGYVDGIFQYLSGMLIKSRSREATLPFELYVEKYNLALQQLTAYDRPVARLMCGLIDFHYNHFREVSQVITGSRIGAIAKYMWGLKSMGAQAVGPDCIPALTPHPLEDLVSDNDTHRLIQWAVASLNGSIDNLKEMEEYLRGPHAGLDTVKVRLLLIHAYLQAGHRELARPHIKAISFEPGFEAWDEKETRG